MSTHFSIIRSQLDGLRLLSFDEFVHSNVYAPYNGPANPLDESKEDLIYQDKIHYLHYLAQLGRVETIRAYLQELSERGEVSNIINDHRQYDFWYGTPLHTAADWNADPEVARVFVEFGADPTIKNYYDDTPGGTNGSNMVPPFDLGLTVEYLDENGNTVFYTRNKEDFTEIDRYLENLQK